MKIEIVKKSGDNSITFSGMSDCFLEKFQPMVFGPQLYDEDSLFSALEKSNPIKIESGRRYIQEEFSEQKVDDLLKEDKHFQAYDKSNNNNISPELNSIIEKSND